MIRISGIFSASLALLLPLLANATVVTDANIILIPAPSGPSTNYSFTTYQDEAGTDPTSVWFNYDGASLEIVNWNIDEELDWYLVDGGDEFTKQNIDAGLFIAIFTVDLPRGPISVGSGDFYLGVNTGLGFSGSAPKRDVFGWIELNVSGAGLISTNNAVAYGSGIIVGASTQVPEPGTGLLFGLGLLGQAAGRRRCFGR